MQPKVLGIADEGYRALQLATSALRFIHKDKYAFTVEDVYFDLGQDWMWTTIICYKGDDSYQILCPRDWEKIVTAKTTDVVMYVVNSLEIVYDKF